MTAAQLSIPSAGTIQRAQLPNGITILAYENPAVQSVNLTGSLHAGSIYEAPDKSGLASLVGAALMTGAAHRDFDAFHGALEAIGADLGIRAYRHKLSFGGKALAEDLPTLVDLARDALRQPTFPPEHVERLRGERLTRLQYSQFDTRYRAGEAMRKALYPPEHAYHRAAAGEEDSIQAITLKDLSAFHARHFGPRGMLIVLVGALNAEEAIAMAADAFGDWQNKEQPPQQPVASPAAAASKRERVFVPGKTQSDISMGMIGPPRQADDFLAAQLANSILGEFGMMGRIGKSVREDKGLAYYAYSRLGGGHGPEPWSVSAGVNPENVDLAIASILEEIERLTQTLVSEEDLADNQSYFTGRMPLRLESNEGIAAHIHSMESFDLGLDYLLGYRERIYSISREDILHAAQKYLAAERMVIAVAGPGQAASAQNAPHG